MNTVNNFFLPKNTESLKLLQGTISGTFRYSGGAYCPVTDRIYFAPWNALQIMEVNPNTDTWSLVGSVLSGVDKFSDFVYVGSGKMVGIPLSYSQCILFDTVTKSITPFGLSSTAVRKWYGGALSNNGFVYATPFETGSSQFLKIDPVGLTSSLVGASLSGTVKLSGLCLAGENKLVSANRTYNYPILFDASTDTWTAIGSDEGVAINKYWSSHAHPDGKAYLVKNNVLQHRSIDISVPSKTSFGVSESSVNRNYGMGLAPNGYFYTTPGSLDFIEKFLPGSSLRNLLQIPITGSEKYLGSPILAPNGSFYYPPVSANRVLKLSNIGNPIASMFEFPASLVGFHNTNWNIYQNRY